MPSTIARVGFAVVMSVLSAQIVRAGEIIDGPLAKLEIAPAEIKSGGSSKGTLTVGWFGQIAPKWFDTVTMDQATAATAAFPYLVLDSMIKAMPQGLLTYSLAEHAEFSADYKRIGFRLRAGLKFQDGTPLTTEDVRWTYESYKGVDAARMKGATERIEVKDARTIIFHFKEPFPDFPYRYSGRELGLGWIVPRHYYERVGSQGFIRQPIGSGPYKFVSQSGDQTVVEAWDGYWRRKPGVKTIVFKSIQSPATGLAALKTGELDVAINMGSVITQVMTDKRLRFDSNLTGTWNLMFPNWEDRESPFNDKRVRQAVSLALNRTFLMQQGTQGLGKPWGSWTSPEHKDAANLPNPEYNTERAKQLLAEAGYPNGLQLEGVIAYPSDPPFAERIANDLRAVGIRASVQIMDFPRYLSARAQGRRGFKSKNSVLITVEQIPGPAAMMVEKFGLCGAPGSLVCAPEVEALWTKYKTAGNPEQRLQLSHALEKYIVGEYITVPVYSATFPHAVGPRVLPEGEAPEGQGFHKYWATPLTPFPFPWEEWEVKD